MIELGIPFTPNWKRMGLPSKEAGVAHVLKYLKENESRIVRAGFSDEVSIIYGNMAILLKGKGAAKENSHVKKQLSRL